MDHARRDYAHRPLSMAELPVPSGWFAVALSRELPRGRVLPARVGRQDLVAWRDETGTACVATAWCPHLGAHLGHLGRVRGPALVCGFHGFAFGADGSCLATGYASPCTRWERGPGCGRRRPKDQKPGGRGCAPLGASRPGRRSDPGFHPARPDQRRRAGPPGLGNQAAPAAAGARRRRRAYRPLPPVGRSVHARDGRRPVPAARQAGAEPKLPSSTSITSGLR